MSQFENLPNYCAICGNMTDNLIGHLKFIHALSIFEPEDY